MDSRRESQFPPDRSLAVSQSRTVQTADRQSMQQGRNWQLPPPKIDEVTLRQFGFSDCHNRAMSRLSTSQVDCYRDRLSQQHSYHPQQQQEHYVPSCQLILLVFGIVLISLLCWDFRSVKASAIVQQHRIITKCEDDFFMNRCTEPMENLQEQCHIWDKCRKKNPKHEVLNTAVLMKVVGGSIGTLLQSAGVAALLVCGLLLLSYCFFQKGKIPAKQH